MYYIDEETGELLVDSHILFSGYFRNDEATARALAGGKYHTGDLAERLLHSGHALAAAEVDAADGCGLHLGIGDLALVPQDDALVVNGVGAAAGHQR